VNAHALRRDQGELEQAALALFEEDGAEFTAAGVPVICGGLEPDYADAEIEMLRGKHITIIQPLDVDPSINLPLTIWQHIAALQTIAASIAVSLPIFNDAQEAIEQATMAAAWLETFGPKRAEKPPGALPLIDPTRWEGEPIPPRRWHVADLIPARTVTKLSGAGGEGKSLLALQLLVSSALGMRWLGRDVPHGRALYLSAEDEADEVQRRMADIVREYGVRFRDLKDLRIAPLAGLDAVLAAPAARGTQIVATPLWTALEEAVGAFRPSIIVIDTLADAFAGDEINRAQARQFIGLLRGLAIRFDMVVMLLAHPSLTGIASRKGSSGSTGWDNSVRSALYLTPAEAQDGEASDPDLRILKTVKSNYARTGSQIAMRWRQGVFVAEEADAPAWLDKKASSTLADTVFLSLLATYTARGSYVSEKPGPSYAPTIFAKDEAAKGARKNVLHAAMNRLFAAGKIVNTTVGTGTRAKTIITLAEG
jgi:RecA-family ATPase